MPQKTFHYILRYKIDPLFNPDDRIAELLRFCRQAGVEEVMLFFLAEELSTGHATLAELKPYVAMARKLKPQLRDQGVALSLNPWTTTYHEPRSRRLRPGQDFTLMVGETGATSSITACPLCPNWRQYICEVFGYLAAEIEPPAIWVEDDFRLHNHGPELGWGGCFCRLHVDRMAQALGREVTRRELLDNLLAPGQPHPWRKIWSDISRDSLLEPARMLRQAVHQACPSTRLGLMTSSPDAHSIEGRDWPALQQALGDQPAFLIRPHMPPYTQSPALSTPPDFTRQTIAALAGPLEIYPELENSPRCGPYSKSGTYNVWQCLNAAAFGSDGITINHFDMMGNGIALDPRFAEFLARSKPRLNALARLDIDQRSIQGLRVLFSPQVADHRHSTDTSSMRSLYNAGTIWSQTLYILSIAHCFTTQITGDGAACAVNDQTLRAFDDQAVEQLLCGPVLLDALSVEVLLERGFGPLLGLESAKWVELSQTVCAYESILEPDPSIFGLANPRMGAQRCAHRLLDMTPTRQADIRSWICSADHQRLFPGALTFTNQAGGRVVSLAYPLTGQKQFFMDFFNRFRRIMLQRILFQIAPHADLAAVDEHPMHLYRMSTARGALFAAFNVVDDKAERLVLRLPKGRLDPCSLKILDNSGTWQSARAKLVADDLCDCLIVKNQIPPLDGLFLLAPSAEPTSR